MYKKLLISLIVVLLTTGVTFALSTDEVLQINTLFSKFSLVMLGVAGFSVIIYIGLSVYNKFFVNNNIKTYQLTKYSLRTPSNIDEALYLFIEKNRLL